MDVVSTIQPNRLDDASLNDNRNYNYALQEWSEREEYKTIIDWIPENSSVIDFGCGNGSLLFQLREQKKANVFGIEISESGAESCRRKNVEVSCDSIDKFHTSLSDKQFDYGVCNVTIQMVMYPEILLREMARVSKQLIVSFPNFGYYRNRLDLLLNGRMPQPTLFNYTWYSTGHIHQLSIVDFEELVNAIPELRIARMGYAEQVHGLRKTIRDSFPNLFCLMPIFLLETR